MAPVPPPPMGPDPMGMGPEGMPDLSHLSEEERQIILQVLQRQKAEEQKEEEIAQKGDRELWDIERQIQERKENAQKLIGTQDDAICQICQKTKFADGIGHKCFYCQLRSCARCGGKTTSKNKNIWACSLCQKRQQILAKTGKWFQQQQQQAQVTQSAAGGQMSQSANSTTPSPVNPISPSPMAGADQGRRQSLKQHTHNAIADAQSPVLHRQGTLRRQRSLEDSHQQQQQSTMNGGDRLVSGPSGTSQMEQNPQGQAPRLNGQMRKASGQQRAQQQSADGEGLVRQKSVRQQNQPMARHQLPTSSHTSRMTPDELQPYPPQQRPSTAGRINSSRPANEGQRQHSTEESRQQRHTPRTAGEHQQPHRRSQAATASSVPFVPAVPGQKPPPSPSSVSARQSATLASGSSPMRMRRSKQTSRTTMQQQHRSYSSSDDELSSPKQAPNSSQGQHLQTGQPQAVLPQGASLQLETKTEPDFSEKELLRYIYDNAHPSAKRAAAGRGGPFFGANQQTHSLDAVGPSLAMNSPQQSGTSTAAATPSNALARRIRNYLSNPAVSWQPSADQRHLIGHIVLYKPSSLALMSVPNSSSASAQGFSSLDFGLKVVGGRNPVTGRLGAFVSRVRPGSVADTVGRLRAGDEVVEWNGHSLQNVTPEGVYNIVQTTKGDSRLELIVSRPLAGGDDDFLNLRRQGVAEQSSGLALPHSQSMTAAPSPFGSQRFNSRRAPSPLVLHAASGGLQGGNYYDPMPTHCPPMAFPGDASDPRICGRLEMALLYLAQKRELIISLSRAYDLTPRPDGTVRNPYVKLFLLPDRSERSRRQSKVLSDTLSPIWDEHFFYEDLEETKLAGRVLEITLWDFDPYESHSFMGETLVELANAPLNNQPFLYNLLDMDEENPIRMRLRQRRFSAMTPPMGQRSRSHMGQSGVQQQLGTSFEDHRTNTGWRNNSHSVQNLAFHMSRTRGGHGNFPLAIGTDAFWQTAEEDWNRNGGGDEEWTAGWEGTLKRGRRMPNGYLSDQEQEWEQERRRRDREHHRRKEHRHQHHRQGGRDRRPQSATALRNIAEWEIRHQGVGQQNLYETEPGAQSHQHNGGKLGGGNRRITRHQELREQEGGGGYGSDGSVETLSVNSAQSMQNRALLRQQQIQRIRDQQQITQQSSNEEGQMAIEDEEEAIEFGRSAAREGQSGGGQPMKGMGASAKEMKERKKSLMTRLIPGRNGPNDANKRLGFARSEEVGIPPEGGGALAPPEQNRDFIKQNSKESTDSSDNWLPILPDRPLGSFMDNLGPGQVVGRQALGSSPLGELHVGLSVEQGTGLVVDVREARNLKTSGPKGVPATYVKAYLMEGKNCVAKAKTQPSKNRSVSPSFRQKLIFAESPRHKMLQLTIIGDFGRMERKSFMGVAQVALDELQLGREPTAGWFKLFHSASLNGSAPPPGSGTATMGGSGGPSRKDSEEVSLN